MSSLRQLKPTALVDHPVFNIFCTYCDLYSSVSIDLQLSYTSLFLSSLPPYAWYCLRISYPIPILHAVPFPYEHTRTHSLLTPRRPIPCSPPAELHHNFAFLPPSSILSLSFANSSLSFAANSTASSSSNSLLCPLPNIVNDLFRSSGVSAGRGIMWK